MESVTLKCLKQDVMLLRTGKARLWSLMPERKGRNLPSVFLFSFPYWIPKSWWEAPRTPWCWDCQALAQPARGPTCRHCIPCPCSAHWKRQGRGSVPEVPEVCMLGRYSRGHGVTNRGWSHDYAEARLHGSPLRVPAGRFPGLSEWPEGGREGAVGVTRERRECSLLWLQLL